MKIKPPFNWMCSEWCTSEDINNYRRWTREYLGPPVRKTVRWEHETTEAAKHLGWTIVETDGVNDYQGWGVHLLRKEVVDADTDAVARDVELEAREGWEEKAKAVRMSGVWHTEWAVLSWSYGSCNVCDGYESEFYGDDTTNEGEKRGSPDHCARIFADLIETCTDEETARLRFSERKGW